MRSGFILCPKQTVYPVLYRRLLRNLYSNPYSLSRLYLDKHHMVMLIEGLKVQLPFAGMKYNGRSLNQKNVPKKFLYMPIRALK